ncbi:beta-ketoacyl synthase N-terminal-like domain-containing protein [Sorangium sp. So ce269]
MKPRSVLPSESEQHRDIAIVGVSCRFPGAADYAAFWENLRAGEECLVELPRERWADDPSLDAMMDLEQSRGLDRFGSIGDVARFDSAFFGISAREAAMLDPQQRILLEEAWRCVEDSGIPLHELRSSRVCTLVGATSVDYLQRLDMGSVEIELGHQLGNYLCGSSNRIAHALGLTGKSLTIDTACASALCALHEAKKTLISHECDYALVGATRVLSHPFQIASFRAGRLLSHQGSCRPFDARADGFARGEGCGVVLLQRLTDALDQGSHIYGLIKGSAVNHAGSRATQFSAPSMQAQRDVVLMAYEDARVTPETVSYMEAHAVGTPIGDAIELRALDLAFREHTAKRQFCAIGSVKANIGHLENVGGMSGLIKVLLMMKHREIPPPPSAVELSPLMDIAATAFQLNAERVPWEPPPGAPRRAGISASGYTGTNAHVVLEEAPEVRGARAGRSDSPHLFLLSAKSAESFMRLLARWRDFVETAAFDASELEDICLTQVLSRQAGDHRWGGVIESKDELRRMLSAAPEATACVGSRLRAHFDASPWKGQSDVARFVGNNAVLRANLDRAAQRMGELDAALLGGFQEPEWSGDRIWAYRLVVNYALFQSLEELGLKFDLISFDREGVLAGLTAAGVLCLEDALAIALEAAPFTEAPLRRPRRNFYDPVEDRVISPLRFGHTELDRLATSSQISDDVLISCVGRSIYLANTQHAYRRRVLEWSGAFKELGLDVTEITGSLERAQAFCGGSRRRRLLLVHIIKGGLHDFLSRWQLSGDVPVSDLGFRVLHRLLGQGLLGKRQVVQWLHDDRSSLEVIAPELDFGACRHDEELEREQAATASLDEIVDRAGWLRKVLSGAGYRGPADRVEVRFAPHASGSVGAAAAAHERAGSLAFLAELWLAGASVSWSMVFQARPYRKVPLPTYPFGGERHWYTPKEDEAASAGAPAPRDDLGGELDRQLMRLFDLLHGPHLHERASK